MPRRELKSCSKSWEGWQWGWPTRRHPDAGGTVKRHGAFVAVRLGQSASIPVLDTLKYFRNEFDIRIQQSVFLRSLRASNAVM